jgi:hypothetical protein
MEDMVAVEKSLKHSRLLVPALLRIARCDYLRVTYDWLERVEAGDMSYDPFFQDKCALAHFQAYPEACILYEKARTIEQDKKLTTDISEAMKRFIEKIAGKANNKFAETESNLSDTENVIHATDLASAIVARLLQINLREDRDFLHIQSVRDLHHCTPYYQEPKYEKIFVLMNDYVSYAKGALDFVEDVRKFLEVEEKDQVNLAEVANFRKLGSEYATIVSSLRTLVQNLIVDIENGISLKGECETCLEKKCSSFPYKKGGF